MVAIMDNQPIFPIFRGCSVVLSSDGVLQPTTTPFPLLPPPYSVLPTPYLPTCSLAHLLLSNKTLRPTFDRPTGPLHVHTTAHTPYSIHTTYEALVLKSERIAASRPLHAIDRDPGTYAEYRCNNLSISSVRSASTLPQTPQRPQFPYGVGHPSSRANLDSNHDSALDPLSVIDSQSPLI